MFGRLGQIDPVTATMLAQGGAAASKGIFDLVELGAKLWVGDKQQEFLEKQLKEQRRQEIAEETQRKIMLAQAEKQAQREAVYSGTSRLRTSQTLALYAVGAVAVGVSGYFIYKALKKRGA